MGENSAEQYVKKFHTQPCYIHRKVAGTDVLISVGENIANFNGYIELNESASFLWEELREPRTEAELAEALERRFGLSPEQAAEDAGDFLRELAAKHMVSEA